MSRDESNAAQHFEDQMQFRTQPESINHSSDEAGQQSCESAEEETPSAHQSPEAQYPIDEEAEVASLIARKEISGHVKILFDDIKVKLKFM